MGYWKKECPKLKNKDKDKSDANIAQNGDDDYGFTLIASSLACHSNK